MPKLWHLTAILLSVYTPYFTSLQVGNSLRRGFKSYPRELKTHEELILTKNPINKNTIFFR